MAMDTQNITSLIAINLLVAFITINHQILINTLDKFYEVKGKAWQWFKSYLVNRSIRVQINKSFSGSLDVPFSVPQVSCTSPILFNLYIGTLETFHGYSKGN